MLGMAIGIPVAVLLIVLLVILLICCFCPAACACCACAACCGRRDKEDNRVRGRPHSMPSLEGVMEKMTM